MGVPLINAIYEDTPLVGAYTLPLLIWHPMQLVIGCFLVPRLHAWVESEKERLDWPKDDDDVKKEDKSKFMDERANGDVEQQSTTNALQPMMSVTPMHYEPSTTNFTAPTPNQNTTEKIDEVPDDASC